MDGDGDGGVLGISGEIEILGFDIASLTGAINLGITPAVGLDAGPDELVPFDEFLDHLCFQITGEVYGSISAEVVGIEVFEFDLPSVDLPFDNSCSFPRRSGRQLGGTFAIPSGDDPVATIKDYAYPALVIAPITSQGRNVQLVDADPRPEVVRQVLASSLYAGGMSPWTTLSEIPEPGQHLSQPMLALTNDGLGEPAVVVYQSVAIPPSGNPAELTSNEFFAAQELRYRYYDGSAGATHDY